MRFERKYYIVHKLHVLAFWIGNYVYVFRFAFNLQRHKIIKSLSEVGVPTRPTS